MLRLFQVAPIHTLPVTLSWAVQLANAPPHTEFTPSIADSSWARQGCQGCQGIQGVQNKQYFVQTRTKIYIGTYMYLNLQFEYIVYLSITRAKQLLAVVRL